LADLTTELNNIRETVIKENPHIQLKSTIENLVYDRSQALQMKIQSLSAMKNNYDNQLKTNLDTADKRYQAIVQDQQMLMQKAQQDFENTFKTM
jgi:hypothetical protein